MEIADLLVLSKADRPGAEQAVMSLKMILGFRPHDAKSWLPDVLKTQANEGKGVEEVAALIQRHRVSLESTGMLEGRRRIRLEHRIREIINDHLHVDFWNGERSRELHQKLELLLQRQSNPYDVAADLLDGFRARSAQSQSDLYSQELQREQCMGSLLPNEQGIDFQLTEEMKLLQQSIRGTKAHLHCREQLWCGQLCDVWESL
jgi:hypothetical protein